MKYRQDIEERSFSSKNNFRQCRWALVRGTADAPLFGPITCYTPVALAS